VGLGFKTPREAIEGTFVRETRSGAGTVAPWSSRNRAF
jgi:hypothetical protein